jgi:hypothetical protein
MGKLQIRQAGACFWGWKEAHTAECYALMMMVETASARFVERARPLVFPNHDPTPLLDISTLRGMD